MIAAFPMYDRPSTSGAYDRLWMAIRDRLRSAGGSAPDALDRKLTPAESWAHPDLVLGQICALPLRLGMAGEAIRLGSLQYDLPGMRPGFYQALYVARQADAGRDPLSFTGGTIAVNDPHSQSGWGFADALAHAHGQPWTHAIQTGSHAASARAVAEGAADIASIDAQTWRHLIEDDPKAHAALCVIGHSPPAPGMTLITRVPAPGLIFDAVVAAIGTLSPGDRARTGLHGLAVLPDPAYDLRLPGAPPF